jgi:hypothetical protein
MKKHKTDEEKAAEVQATADLRRALEGMVPELAAAIFPGIQGEGRRFIPMLARRLAEGGWRYPEATTMHAIGEVFGSWPARVGALFAGREKVIPTPDERQRLEAVFEAKTAALLMLPRPADTQAWADEIARQVEEEVARMEGEPMENVQGKARAVVNELMKQLCACRGAAIKYLPEAIRKAGGGVP